MSHRIEENSSWGGTPVRIKEEEEEESSLRSDDAGKRKRGRAGVLRV